MKEYRRLVMRIIQNILKSPVFRWSVVLYGVTFLILLPVMCRNMKHSIYFSAWKDVKDGISSTKALDQHRLQLANEFMKHLNSTSLPWKQHQSTTEPVVVISIITQLRRGSSGDRYKSRYLTQTLMKLIELNRKMQSDFALKIFVCNVDFDPKHYKEVLDLEAVADVKNRFDKLVLTTIIAKEKEKQDYVFCLNKSLDYKGQYIFLIEDDALPRDDALEVLRHIVHFHVSANSTPDHATVTAERIAFIKFYHPDRLLQFTSAGFERIPELLSVAAVLSSLVTGLSALSLTSQHASALRTHLLWSYWFVFFVLVALCIGRTNLLELRRLLSPHLYSLTPAPSCCTQAILYPRKSAKLLLQYMATKKCNNTYAKDHILDEFPKLENLNAYLVQPNVFEHIGLYSAVRGHVVNPLYL